MKICYIAHPIGAPTKKGIETNLADLRRIIRKINLKFPDIVPFCPYYADIVSMDDNVPEERQRGIFNDQAIIQSGLVNELWLTGDRLTDGMKAERLLAIENNITVVNMICLL
jgi:hypothetical protein